jgi:hypothetical protein
MKLYQVQRRSWKEGKSSYVLYWQTTEIIFDDLEKAKKHSEMWKSTYDDYTPIKFHEAIRILEFNSNEVIRGSYIYPEKPKRQNLQESVENQLHQEVQQVEEEPKESKWKNLTKRFRKN